MGKLPGWGTLAGFAAKWLDPLFDSATKIDRRIERLQNEKKKQGTTVDRLTDIDNDIIKLRRKRDRILRRD